MNTTFKFMVKEGETYWDTLTRLAQEVSVRCVLGDDGAVRFVPDPMVQLNQRAAPCEVSRSDATREDFAADLCAKAGVVFARSEGPGMVDPSVVAVIAAEVAQILLRREQYQGPR